MRSLFLFLGAAAVAALLLLSERQPIDDASTSRAFEWGINAALCHQGSTWHCVKMWWRATDIEHSSPGEAESQPASYDQPLDHRPPGEGSGLAAGSRPVGGAR